MQRPATIRHGKVRIELSGEIREWVDNVVAALPKETQDQLQGFLDQSEAYVNQYYPDKGKPGFPAATGFSKSSFHYDMTVERSGLVIAAEVFNDATNWGKLPLLIDEFNDLERRFLSGERLAEHQIKRLRLLRNVTQGKGAKSPQPYVIFVHKGEYWQYLRKLRNLMLKAAGEALTRKRRTRRGK